jgi:hypothetical protein
MDLDPIVDPDFCSALQFPYLVSLYHHYHLLQQEHGKLEA